jgi:hypothetical protein
VSDIAVLAEKVDQLEHLCRGNGQDGLVQKVETLRLAINRFETAEFEREKQQVKRHQENAEMLGSINSKLGHRTLWWTIAGVAVSLAGVAFAVLAIGVSVWLARHADVTPEQIFTRYGDKIVKLNGGKVEAFGVLRSAVPDNDYCNGNIAVVQSTVESACLCDCLHVDDLAAILAEKGLDKRPEGK